MIAFKKTILIGVWLLITAIVWRSYSGQSFTPSRDAAKPAAQKARESAHWAAHSVTAQHTESPSGPLVVHLDFTDPLGREPIAGCATCHAGRTGRPVRSSAELDTYHRGLEFSHGNLLCASCHSVKTPDQLQLADGTLIAAADALRLCAQCHGPEAQAYGVGAHGGMAGSWSPKYGDQHRLHCVDCHDPHVPAFPRMKVTFKPVDRFLVPDDDSHSE